MSQLSPTETALKTQLEKVLAPADYERIQKLFQMKPDLKQWFVDNRPKSRFFADRKLRTFAEECLAAEKQNTWCALTMDQQLKSVLTNETFAALQKVREIPKFKVWFDAEIKFQNARSPDRNKQDYLELFVKDWLARHEREYQQGRPVDERLKEIGAAGTKIIHLRRLNADFQTTSENTVKQFGKKELIEYVNWVCKYESHYYALGVLPNASAKDIKKTHKKLARKYHPDRPRAKSIPDHEELFKTVQEAWEVLGDPNKRREYDQERFSAAAAKQKQSFSRKTYTRRLAEQSMRNEEALIRRLHQTGGRKLLSIPMTCEIPEAPVVESSSLPLLAGLTAGIICVGYIIKRRFFTKKSDNDEM